MGPLNIDERIERLLFWPDTRGIGLRQVQAALAAEDQTTTDAATLQGKSVAMQGFGALEYLLFGTGSDSLGIEGGDGFRCSYAAAIGKLTDGITQTVNGEWRDESADGPLAHMLDPQPDAQDYRTLTEVLQKLYATLINGSDTIRDQRLSPVLSFTTGKPKPRLALFWRSGMTAKVLEANFAGLRDFFRAAKFEAALGRQYRWIASGTEFEFQGAIDAARAVPASMEEAVADPDGLLALKQMYVSTGSLDTLVGENLSVALGLSAGFSALDGD
jgi:predicted lipoprotein